MCNSPVSALQAAAGTSSQSDLLKKRSDEGNIGRDALLGELADRVAGVAHSIVDARCDKQQVALGKLDTRPRREFGIAGDYDGAMTSREAQDDGTLRFARQRSLGERLNAVAGSLQEGVAKHRAFPTLRRHWFEFFNLTRGEAVDDAVARGRFDGEQLALGVGTREVRGDRVASILVVQALHHVGGDGRIFLENAANNGVHDTQLGDDKDVAGLRHELKTIAVAKLREKTARR